MGFLFTVMGLRAFGVSQRPFVGSVGAECEFWVVWVVGLDLEVSYFEGYDRMCFWVSYL